MITEKQAKKYVAEGGVNCPVCGSDQVEGDSFDADQGNAWQNVRCHDCGESWTDEYRLTGITEAE